MTNKYPLGFWKCTKSVFSSFKEGLVYECRLDATGEPRIFTHERSNSLAPFWSNHMQRFCYKRSELDFIYVGPSSDELEKKEVDRVTIFYKDGSYEELKK